MHFISSFKHTQINRKTTCKKFTISLKVHSNICNISKLKVVKITVENNLENSDSTQFTQFTNIWVDWYVYFFIQFYIL